MGIKIKAQLMISEILPFFPLLSLKEGVF